MMAYATLFVSIFHYYYLASYMYIKLALMLKQNDTFIAIHIFVI